MAQGKYTYTYARYQGLKKGEGVCSKGAYFRELTVYIFIPPKCPPCLSASIPDHILMLLPLDFLHYPFLWHTVESCVVKFSCFIISCKNIFAVWNYPWNFLAVNRHYGSFVPRFSDQEWDYMYTRQENTQSTELLKELTAFMATMQLLVNYSRAEENWETYTGTVTVKTDGHWESCDTFATNLIRSTV